MTALGLARSRSRSSPVGVVGAGPSSASSSSGACSSSPSAPPRMPGAPCVTGRLDPRLAAPARRDARVAARARARRLRARPGARAARAPTPTTLDGVRLLLDRLLARRAPPRRRGRQPHADRRLPGEPRHGVPEGMGGAGAAAPRPTGRPRRCCATRRARSQPGRLGRRRSTTFVHRFKAIQAEHGPESVAFLVDRPDPDRGDGAARRARQVRHGHASTATATPASAWRRRSSPTSSRSGSTRRRTPTPTSRSPTSSCWSARTSASPTRSCGSASAATRTTPRSSSIDPRAHRDGDGRDPAPTRRRRSPTSSLLYGLGRAAHRARLPSTATSSTRTPTGFDDFAAHVAAVHARAGGRRRPGSPPSELERLADTHRRAGERVSFWWTMGVNQSHEGVRTAQAIIDLALMTGNIGRPGTGANSITGQCNAMGSRLFSQHHQPARRPRLRRAAITGQGRRGPRHRRVAHPRPSRAWPTTRSSRASATGEIKALWVIATNTAHSWINQTDLARRARPARLPRRAGHVRRPPRPRGGPTSCCRPPGGARRRARSSTPSGGIGLVKRCRRAPGPGARRLLDLQADRRGVGLRRDVPRGGRDPEAVFEILQRAVAPAGRATSPASTATSELDAGGVQWPCPRPAPRPTARTTSGSSAACSRDGRFFTPTAGPGSSSTSRVAPPERDRRPLSPRAAHRAGRAPRSGTPRPAPRSRRPCAP